MDDKMVNKFGKMIVNEIKKKKKYYELQGEEGEMLINSILFYLKYQYFVI